MKRLLDESLFAVVVLMMQSLVRFYKTKSRTIAPLWPAGRREALMSDVAARASKPVI